MSDSRRCCRTDWEPTLKQNAILAADFGYMEPTMTVAWNNIRMNDFRMSLLVWRKKNDILRDCSIATNSCLQVWSPSADDADTIGGDATAGFVWFVHPPHIPDTWTDMYVLYMLTVHSTLCSIFSSAVASEYISKMGLYRLTVSTSIQQEIKFGTHKYLFWLPAYSIHLPVPRWISNETLAFTSYYNCGIW